MSANELHHAWWSAMSRRVTTQVVCGCGERATCADCDFDVAAQRSIERQLRELGEWREVPE